MMVRGQKQAGLGWGLGSVLAALGLWHGLWALSLGPGAWGLGPGAWGLGPGAWGLNLGAWSLGLRHEP